MKDIFYIPKVPRCQQNKTDAGKQKIAKIILNALIIIVHINNVRKIVVSKKLRCRFHKATTSTIPIANRRSFLVDQAMHHAIMK